MRVEVPEVGHKGSSPVPAFPTEEQLAAAKYTRVKLQVDFRTK